MIDFYASEGAAPNITSFQATFENGKEYSLSASLVAAIQDHVDFTVEHFAKVAREHSEGNKQIEREFYSKI